MIISGNLQRVLKIFHLLAVSLWIGGCLSAFLIYVFSVTAESGDEFFGFMRGYRFVSTYVNAYLGAFGSFFTGLAYSLCTNRGFVRHKWIIIKWLSTLYLMYCGSFYLGPWSVEILEAAQTIGLEALGDPAFAAIRSRHITMAVINMGLLVILTAISVFKPWEISEAIAMADKKLRKAKEI